MTQTMPLSSSSSQALRDNGIEKEVTAAARALMAPTPGSAAAASMTTSKLAGRCPSGGRSAWSEGLLMLLLVVLPIATSLALVACWMMHTRQVMNEPNMC